jgi:hypothetical protein
VRRRLVADLPGRPRVAFAREGEDKEERRGKKKEKMKRKKGGRKMKMKEKRKRKRKEKGVINIFTLIHLHGQNKLFCRIFFQNDFKFCRIFFQNDFKITV